MGVMGFVRGCAGALWWVVVLRFCAGPVTLSRSARRFWFCPYGTTGFGFLDGRLVGTKGICWVDRDSVTGVFGGRWAGYSVDGVGAVRVIVVGGRVGGFVRGP